MLFVVRCFFVACCVLVFVVVCGLLNNAVFGCWLLMLFVVYHVLCVVVV